VTAAVRALDVAAIADTCFSAVFSDVCDQLGARNCTARADIRPVNRPGDVLVGWARTARSVTVEDVPRSPYSSEIDYIDSLGPDDVVVASVGGEAAFWGELFTSAAVGRGARGAVIDGYVRDQARFADLPFSVHAKGGRPTDSLGRISIAEVDQPITVGGAAVRTGDLVIADVDGVTFVPAELVVEAVDRAFAKATTESRAKQMLLRGSTLAAAWERFRVL
jgi:4-hydroxy-4-methyl-2-oxoglutarate aldolase